MIDKSETSKLFDLPPAGLFDDEKLDTYGKHLQKGWAEIIELLNKYVSPTSAPDSKVFNINELTTDFIHESLRTAHYYRTNNAGISPDKIQLFAHKLAEAFTSLYSTLKSLDLFPEYSEVFKNAFINIDLENDHGLNGVEEKIMEFITPVKTLPLEFPPAPQLQTAMQTRAVLRSIDNEWDDEPTQVGNNAKLPPGPPSTKRSFSFLRLVPQAAKASDTGKPKPAQPAKPKQDTPQALPVNPPAAQNPPAPLSALQQQLFQHLQTPEEERSPEINKKKPWLGRTTKGLAIALTALTSVFAGKAIYDNSGNESAKTVTSSTTPPVNSVKAPDPKITEVDNPEKVENNSVARYGFDLSSEKFTSFKKFFRNQQMYSFDAALDRASRQTKMETKNAVEPGRLEIYEAFLDTAVKLNNKKGAVHDYFNIRRNNLKAELSRTRDPQKIFRTAGKEEDLRLFETINNPIRLPDPNLIAGCSVVSDPVVNHALARFGVMMKDASSFSSIVTKAVTDTENEPCPCDDVMNCAFDRADNIARLAQEKNPKDGSRNMLGTFRKLTKDGQPNYVSEIFKVTREIPKNKPLIGNANNTPKNQPASPAHTFNDFEKEFFDEGRRIDRQHIQETEENRKWVAAYPEWFPAEPRPKKPGIFTRALSFAQNLFVDKRTEEEKEIADLKRSIPKKSLWQNLWG